jgi:phage portal protein BeeE
MKKTRIIQFGITPWQEIRAELLRRNIFLTDIARVFGVSDTMIGYVIRGRSKSRAIEEYILNLLKN